VVLPYVEERPAHTAEGCDYWGTFVPTYHRGLSHISRCGAGKRHDTIIDFDSSIGRLNLEVPRQFLELLIG
jgi:hypothetical protein